MEERIVMVMKVIRIDAPEIHPPPLNPLSLYSMIALRADAAIKILSIWSPKASKIKLRMLLVFVAGKWFVLNLSCLYYMSFSSPMIPLEFEKSKFLR